MGQSVIFERTCRGAAAGKSMTLVENVSRADPRMIAATLVAMAAGLTRPALILYGLARGQATPALLKKAQI